MTNNTYNSGGHPGKTTAAPSVLTGNEVRSDVEFVDASGLRAMFGLKRSLAYTLLAEGSIRGVSLRKPGSLRGKRLFHVESVRAYLHRQMEDGQ